MTGMAATDPAFVQTSSSGLPSASVSHGVLGGKFVPRNRRYCDAVTSLPLMRNVMRLNSPAAPDAAFQVCRLYVRRMPADVFFAPAGTEARLGFVVGSASIWLADQSRGHSPE